MIYQPAEDSYLLEKSLKDFLKNKDKSIKILDMGTVYTPIALGISVEIKAGDGQGHFEFKMVGAGN